MRAGVVAVFALGASLAAGCGGSSTSSSAAASVAAAASAAPTSQPGWPLTVALRAQLARTFAPELRFNAWHDDGNTSPQNAHEDFFPMSVARFLAELEAGAARVLVQPARRAAVGVSQVRPFAGTPQLTATHLDGFPRFMTGDEPGTAPTYVHVYEDPTARGLAPDGSGDLVVHVEYWCFYGYDRCEAVLLGFVPTSGSGDFLGHRGDWEHLSYRLRVRLAPGGALAAADLDAGTYYGHGGGVVVPAAELERVDDQGQADPAGTHPVVYVAQGKHAAYPQAGEWPGHAVPSWIAQHTDFFRGNGVRVACWRAPLPDLEDTAAAPQEFAPPAFDTIKAFSPGPLAATLRDWTDYRGTWGPDLTVSSATALTLRIGLSPTGPKAKSKYGDFGGIGTYPLWSDVKAREPNLKVYRDRGVVIPDVVPEPAPLRL